MQYYTCKVKAKNMTKLSKISDRAHDRRIVEVSSLYSSLIAIEEDVKGREDHLIALRFAFPRF